MEETQEEARGAATVGARGELAERPWRWAMTVGAGVGIATGIVASLADLVSMKVAHPLHGGPALTLAVLVSLLAPLFGVGGATAALWIYKILRYAEGSGPRPALRLWVASGLLTLPLTLGVLWVPWSWLTEHWKALGTVHKAFAVALYCALLLAGIVAGRALLWARAEKANALLRAHWPLIAASAGATAIFYWADLTKYVDLYTDFHYGLAGAFTLSVASSFLLVGMKVQGGRFFRLPTQSTGRSIRAGIATVLVACAALLATREVDIRSPRALIFGKAVRSLQSASDFDGDGHSTVLGSTDCAPLDRARSPSEIDVPGNGVDEDCTGADSSRWPTPAPRSHYEVPRLHERNLLLITVDALRADRLSVYGHRRNTSPRIDRLAREGILFTNAYAQATTTYNSVPSLFTGLYPANLPRDYQSIRARGQKTYVYTLTEEAPLLTELLKARGYQTHAIVTLGLLRNLGLDRGFDGYDRTTVAIRKANQLTQKANAFLAQARQPFFLWLHYDEPHDPYDEYPEFQFGDADIDRYDGEIAAVDAQIGLVLDRLQASGLADKTLVVLTADHGDEFREHGGQYHAEKLHRELLHVPLVLSGAGLTPRREEQLVELTDVTPSLCEALKLTEDCAGFDGQSLWATLAGQRDNGFGFNGAYAEVMMRDGVLQRRSLLTHEYRFNVYLDTQAQELYDGRADPGEQRNVARSLGSVVASFQDQIALRPYRKLGGLFERAQLGDSAGLVSALPRIRAESMLRFAVATIAQHPTHGAKAALEHLLRRPGLSSEMVETVSMSLSRLGP